MNTKQYYTWPPVEDETDIPDYRLGYGGYQPQAAPNLNWQKTATDTAVKGSSLIPGIGLGAQALGIGLNAYGAYKQGQQADRDFEEQKDQFEWQKEISLEDRERQEEEKRRRAMLEAGQYAGNYLDRARQSYGRYNAMTGM